MATSKMHRKEPFKLFIILFLCLAQVYSISCYSVYLPESANYAKSRLINIALDSSSIPNKEHHHNHHKYIYSVESVDPHDSTLKLNASKWIHLDSHSGELILNDELKCSSGHLDYLTPRPLKLIIQALQYSLTGPTARTVQLLRFPLEIYFDHSTCEPLTNVDEQLTIYQLESQLSNQHRHYETFHDCDTCIDDDFRPLELSIEHLALIQQVNNLNERDNCFRDLQYLTNLNQLVPLVFRQQCSVQFKLTSSSRANVNNNNDNNNNNEIVKLNNNNSQLELDLNSMTNENQFKIQRNLNDLIVSNSHCQDKDVFNLSTTLLINCDLNKRPVYVQSTVLLSSRQLIDVVLAKSNNIQLNQDGVQHFLNQRHHQIKYNRPKLKHYLDSIQNDLQLILGDDLEINSDNEQKRSKRELKSSNQMSSPYFDRKFYIVNVPEEQEKGQIVTTLTAKNQNPNQQIVYSMNAVLDARSQSMFKIDESTGLITTTTKLDREFMSVHYLKVFAAELSLNGQEDLQNQTVQKSAQITLQINVLDINDHTPVFEKSNYEAIIKESQPVNSNVATVRATDLDAGANAELEYSISQIDICNNGQSDSTTSRTTTTSKELKETFKIDAKSGVIKTNVQLDRETISCYELIIQVNDLAQPGQRKQSQANMIVRVFDENDSYPQFTSKSYSVSIREDINFNEKPLIIQIKATDEDENLNSVLRYSIISGNQLNHFSINTLNGEIYVIKQLDYEQNKFYRLMIRAQDTGSPPKANVTNLLVNIIDVNDNLPIFYNSLMQETVPENTKENENIMKVQAFDADDGNNAKIFYAIKYNGEILDEKVFFDQYKEESMHLENRNETNANYIKSILPFRIDHETGWIYTTKQLDYEEQSMFEFQCIARDYGIPYRESSTQVIIKVDDLNDNNPIFSKKNYELTISELTKVGAELLKLSATDMDEKSRLFYSIVNGNSDNKFNLINKQMTNEAVLTLMSKLDYKMAKNYQLTVQVADAGGRTDFCSVLVNISDSNTHAPVIEKIIPNNMPIQLSEDLALNTVVAITEARDDDSGENARLTFSILNNNNAAQQFDSKEDQSNRSSEFPFKIDANTGVITLTRKLDREQVSGYSFIVNVNDNGIPSLSDTVNIEFEIIDVNDNHPHFEKSVYNVSIEELVPIGTNVLTVHAIDFDIGINAQVRYSLIDATIDFLNQGNTFSAANYASAIQQNNYNLNFNNPNSQQPHFTIDSASGVIRTNKLLDRETQPVYYLVAQAFDKGQPALSNATLIVVRIDDINDSPPRFPSEKYVFYISENSPLNSIVGRIKAEDADEGQNAIISYEIVPGLDSNLFKLVERKQENACELLTNTELDFESSKKVYNLVVRASSPPLRNDVEVEIFVTDINDNLPRINDFTIVFNNYKNHFPLNIIGKAPGTDVDINDSLKYRFVTGNRANLILLNETTGEITLSPYLNTNVPTKAQFEISVSDGLNEASALMNLVVNLVTEKMLQNSITIRLSSISVNDFLHSVYNRFLDSLSSIIQCNRDNIVIFNIQEDLDTMNLNVSLSIRLDNDIDMFFSPNILKERIYLNKQLLRDLIDLKILPFDDNICVHEPCINFEQCNVVSKFKTANDFIHAKNFLFRPVVTVDTFTCSCPSSYTGFSYRLDCDTELNLCHSSPCLNNGKCIQAENGYTCACEPSFTGNNCEFNLEENLDDVCDQSELCKSGSRCISLAAKRSVNKRQSPESELSINSSIMMPSDNLNNSQHLSLTMNDDKMSIKSMSSITASSATVMSIDNFYCMNCSNSEWSNEFCELKSRSFTSGSYLTFNTIKNRHRFHISLKFATTQTQGLLFYNGRFNEQNDFISLQFKDNNLVFSYSTGSSKNDIIIQTTKNYLSNGEWHHVEINYVNRTVLMKLDECNDALLKKHLSTLNYQYSINPFILDEHILIYSSGMPSGSSEYLAFTCANFNHLKLDSICSDKLVNCNRFLDLNGPLQLGGLPQFESKSENLLIKQFDGCISEFHINHKLLDMNSYVFNNGTKIGCEPKKKFCSFNACKNDGKCREIWNSYVCHCKNGYSGKNCEDHEPNHLKSFKEQNSYLSFSPNLLPISAPWKVKFSFKTTQKNSLLMQIQLGLTSHIAYFLANGTFNLLMNKENFQISSLDLSNGDWNHIETIWSLSSLTINFNYGELMLTKEFNNELRGLVVTKVVLGKYEEPSELSSSSSDDSYSNNGLIVIDNLDTSNQPIMRTNFISSTTLLSLPNFNGCLQSLEINGNRDGWLNPIESNGIQNSCTYEDPCNSNACSTLSNENSMCINHDLGHYECQCRSNQYYGSQCKSICDLKPCENNGKCLLNAKSSSGYTCFCPHNYTGVNCESVLSNQLTCPLNWWKSAEQTSCTPCGCDVKLGLNSACNKLNGQCECEENHFQLNLKDIFKKFLFKYTRNIKTDLNTKFNYNKVGKQRFDDEQSLKMYLKSDNFNENSLTEVDYSSPLTRLVDVLVNNELYRRNLVRSIYSNEADSVTSEENVTGDDVIDETNFEPVLNDFLYNDNLFNHVIKQKLDLSKLNKVCMDCSCNTLGSYSQNCSSKTGACACKPGVIGRKCDQCSSSLAEITINGCEVIYDGCPSQLNERIWWPKTKFNQMVTQNCPANAIGQAKRYCSDDYGWLEADLFTCISNEFKDLAEQLAILEKNNLPLTTYLSIKISSELKSAVTTNKALYGGDILISAKLVHYIINNELKQSGLNLTHKQDQHFLQNLISIISEIFNSKYEKHWEKINNIELLRNELKYDRTTKKNDDKPTKMDFEDYLNDDSGTTTDAKNELIKKVMKLSLENSSEFGTSINAEKMLNVLVKYSTILLLNQEDTFTSPFQITTNNIVYSMDTVSTDELWNLNEINYLRDEKRKTVQKRDLNEKWSEFKNRLISSIYLKQVDQENCVQFPKYNNFAKQSAVVSENSFKVLKDSTTKILLPLQTLQVKDLNDYLKDVEQRKPRKEHKKAVIIYSIYNSVGKFLQMNFDHTIKTRFGVPIEVNSPLISLNVKPANNLNDTNQVLNQEQQTKVHFVFKLLQQYSYSNPQCAHFDLSSSVSPSTSSSQSILSNAENELMNSFLLNKSSYSLLSNTNPEYLSSVKGVWSTKGCKLNAIYPQQAFTNVINYVNCTCDRGHIFAVLMDRSENKFYFEVSSLLNIVTSTVNLISLTLLLLTVCSLLIVFGEHQQTNCNSIHRNISICALCCNLLFVISSIWRNNLLQFEFQCKLMAILLQYFYLSAFCWLLVCSIHLQRMLSELRDINRGPMHFYNLVGFALPALITAISLAVRADQYGNYLFCWLSVHEAVFWSMLGPIVLFLILSLINFALALRSSIQIKHSIADYSNLSTIIWLNIIWFFFLTVNCFLSIFASNNALELPFYLVTFSFLLNAIYLFTGYCLLNARVRYNIRVIVRRLQSKSVSNESLNQTKTSVLMHNSKSYMSQTLSSPTTAKQHDLVDQPFSAANLQSTFSNSQAQIGSRLNKSAFDFASNFDSSTTTTSHSTNMSKHHHRRRHRKKSSMNDLNDSMDNYIDPYGRIDYDNDEDTNEDPYQSYTLGRRGRQQSSNQQLTARRKKSMHKIYTDIDNLKSTKHYDNIDNYTPTESNNQMNTMDVSSGYANTARATMTPSSMVPTSSMAAETSSATNYDIYQMPNQLFSNMPINLMNTNLTNLYPGQPQFSINTQNIYSNSIEIEAQSRMNTMPTLPHPPSLPSSNQTQYQFASRSTQPFNRQNIFAMIDEADQQQIENTYQNNTINAQSENNLRLVNYSMTADEDQLNQMTQEVNKEINEIVEDF